MPRKRRPGEALALLAFEGETWKTFKDICYRKRQTAIWTLHRMIEDYILKDKARENKLRRSV
jgi:hypothetical protein